MNAALQISELIDSEDEPNELEFAILDFDIPKAVQLIQSRKYDLEADIPHQYYNRTYLNLVCTGNVTSMSKIRAPSFLNCTTIANYPQAYCILTENLIQCGADVNTVDRFGRTPLANVIHYQAIPLFKLLMKYAHVCFGEAEIKALRSCHNISWILNAYQELKSDYYQSLPKLPFYIRQLILYYTIPRLPSSTFKSWS